MHKEFYSFLSSEIQVLIEKHKEDLDVNNPRDFIDYFLVDMEHKFDLDEEDQEERLRTLIIYIFIVSSYLFCYFSLYLNNQVQLLNTGSGRIS